MNEIEKVVSIVKQFNMLFVKINKKINVTVAIEAGSED